VVAPPGALVARARSRDGLDERATEARLAAQLPLEEKRALADHVIDNAGSLDELFETTDRVLDAICEKLGISAARYPKPPG
jgi:dephospho-CoA kinase